MNVKMLAALIVSQTISHSQFNALAVKLVTIATGFHLSYQWTDFVCFTALAMSCFRVIASVLFHRVPLVGIGFMLTLNAVLQFKHLCS